MTNLISNSSSPRNIYRAHWILTCFPTSIFTLYFLKRLSEGSVIEVDSIIGLLFFGIFSIAVITTRYVIEDDAIITKTLWKFGHNIRFNEIISIGCVSAPFLGLMLTISTELKSYNIATTGIKNRDE
jgi:ABC-type Mn2+/Zn2+ transport system permease subunit